MSTRHQPLSGGTSRCFVAISSHGRSTVDSPTQHAQQVIVLKLKASRELGAWAEMTTICKKEVDLTAYVEAQSAKEDLSMSMPFTAKSGYGAAVAGCPNLIASITAQLLGSKVIITLS